jgi:propanol-preferring alcohol dehydrogenase
LEITPRTDSLQKKLLPNLKMGYNIPKEQWAQVIEKVGGPVEYKKIPVAKPGPGEVLVNVKYSGVCHT